MIFKGIEYYENWIPTYEKLFTQPPPICKISLFCSMVLVQVWNLENMLPILALQRHEKPVQALALCQDSVFTGSEDMAIKVSFPLTLPRTPSIIFCRSKLCNKV